MQDDRRVKVRQPSEIQMTYDDDEGANYPCFMYVSYTVQREYQNQPIFHTLPC